MIFKLPDLGEGLQEAELIAWHVAEGDHVVADQPLLSVETDKAVVEIPSPQAGRIEKLFGAPGDIIQIGAPLVTFAGESQPDKGTVVGEIPGAEATQTARRSELKAPGGVIPKSSPAARDLARRLNMDLTVVSASGPKGTISKADVQRAADDLEAAGPLEPLLGVRRAMAARMTQAHAEVVPATVMDIADIEAWARDSDATLRLIRALAVACMTEPALNAWYLGRDTGRRLNRQVDLGIAMDTPDGLFVPVLRNAGKRNEMDIRRGLQRMKKDIQTRTVPVEELRGQTITLSNFGMFGGQHAALVVVPPQVAILGAGRIHPRVLPWEGSPAIRRVLPLSLTFDHRAVMGREATRFLAAAIADLERPA